MIGGSRPVGSGLVLIERRQGYNILTLNRADKRNAMNLAIQDDMREAFELSLDARAIVIHGAPPTFCAGIDLAEQRELRASNVRVPSQDGYPWSITQERIRRHSAVFIAAVSGAALGGGLTLVHSCELAVADESAEFGVPELTFGTVPALSGPATVHRLLPKHAAHLIFLGQRINAATALQFGIVNEVVPDGQSLVRAIEMAETIAGYNPIAVDYSKKLFRETLDVGWTAALDYGVSLGSLSRAEIARLASFDADDVKGGS